MSPELRASLRKLGFEFVDDNKKEAESRLDVSIYQVSDDHLKVSVFWGNYGANMGWLEFDLTPQQLLQTLSKGHELKFVSSSGAIPVSR
jgi:hypothetical protein